MKSSGWLILGRLATILRPGCRLFATIANLSRFSLWMPIALLVREVGTTLRIAATLAAGNRANFSGALQVLPLVSVCDLIQSVRSAKFEGILPRFLFKHGVPARLSLRTGSIHDS